MWCFVFPFCEPRRFSWFFFCHFFRCCPRQFESNVTSIIVCTCLRHTHSHWFTYEKQQVIFPWKLKQNTEKNYCEKMLSNRFPIFTFSLKVRLSAASAPKASKLQQATRNAMLVKKVVSTNTVFQIIFHWELGRYRNKCEQVKSKW